MQQSPLFQPLSLRQVTLRNRIVMAPMVSNMGITSQQGICWYRERARGGVGLVIVESTWLASFHDPAFVAGLPALARAVHAEGAAIVVQLHQPADIGGEAVAVTGGGSAREVTAAEIERIVADYAHAARVCADAGFDGVEPHGAHGFLLNQFFSPRTNQRRDLTATGSPGGCASAWRSCVPSAPLRATVCSSSTATLPRRMPLGATRSPTRSSSCRSWSMPGSTCWTSPPASGRTASTRRWPRR
ncbi:MAG: hypothetical protein GX774_06745 [Armatimonadetes bacterium]|nr:hypothetical protein [Armatimonadota bacterium]